MQIKIRIHETLIMGMLDLFSSRVLLIFTFTGTEKKKCERASVWRLLVSFICFILPWVFSVSSHIGNFLLFLRYVMTLLLLWQAVWTVDLCRAQSVIQWHEMGSHAASPKAQPNLSHCFLKEESIPSSLPAWTVAKQCLHLCELKVEREDS